MRTQASMVSATNCSMMNKSWKDIFQSTIYIRSKQDMEAAAAAKVADEIVC